MVVFIRKLGIREKQVKDKASEVKKHVQHKSSEVETLFPVKEKSMCSFCD